MKRTAFAALLVFLIINAANGLQKKPIYNLPDPEAQLTPKQIEALYKKALADDAPPKEAIELELKYRIPIDFEVDEKEIYFRNFLHFSVDERGHVYAPDSSLKVVYEFGPSGKLYSKYAKAGQGPGEMNFPVRVFFIKNEAALAEGVGKLLFFDRKWTYLRTVPTKNCTPFGMAPNGDIFGKDASRDKLIRVLDRDGKIIRRFGEPRYPQKPESTLNHFIAGRSPSGSIWVCFTALGLIRIYSEAGELLKEFDFQEHLSDPVKEQIRENFAFERKGNPRSWQSFWSLAFLEDECLITGGGLTRPIFRVDENGNLKSVYFIPPRRGVYRECHFVSRGEKGEEIFFIKNDDAGERSICVYKSINHMIR